MQRRVAKKEVQKILENPEELQYKQSGSVGSRRRSSGPPAEVWLTRVAHNQGILNCSRMGLVAEE